MASAKKKCKFQIWTYMFHSEILASLNLFVPLIREEPYTEMLLWQFSNTIIYVKIVGKIPYQYLNVWLFSNLGDKVQKRWRTTGQISPILSTRIWTLSPGLENTHTLKCWFGIFPTILTYIIMLENLQNNISWYGCFPIQRTKLYSCWNLMKPGSQNGTYIFTAQLQQNLIYVVIKTSNKIFQLSRDARTT